MQLDWNQQNSYHISRKGVFKLREDRQSFRKAWKAKERENQVPTSIHSLSQTFLLNIARNHARKTFLLCNKGLRVGQKLRFENFVKPVQPLILAVLTFSTFGLTGLKNSSFVLVQYFCTQCGVDVCFPITAVCLSLIDKHTVLYSSNHTNDYF